MGKLLGDVIAPTAALIGGDIAGRAFGNKMVKTSIFGGGNNNPAPQVPQAIVDGANGSGTLDAQAQALRAQQRRIQAQDLSLFTLSNNSSTTNNNNLLGL